MEEGGLQQAGGVCILTCSCSVFLSYKENHRDSHWILLATLDQLQICLDVNQYIRDLIFRLQ